MSERAELEKELEKLGTVEKVDDEYAGIYYNVTVSVLGRQFTEYVLWWDGLIKLRNKVTDMMAKCAAHE